MIFPTAPRHDSTSPPNRALPGPGHPLLARTIRRSAWWLYLLDALEARQRARLLSANAGETVGEPPDQGTIGTSPEA